VHSWYCWKALGFNEGDLKKIRPKLWEILSFEQFFIIGNSIELQKMVLEGKNSLATNSHLGQ